MLTQKHSSPDTATQLAAKHNLGRPIKTYYTMSLAYVFIGSFFIFLSILSFSLAFYMSRSSDQFLLNEAEQQLKECGNCDNAAYIKNNISKYQFSLEHDIPNILSLGGTLVVSIMALSLLFQGWRFRKQNIYLFTGGLLYSNRGHESIVRWDEVDGIAFKENTKTLLFIKDDGCAFIMPTWSGGFINPDAIEDTLLPYLLPSLLGRYANGEALVFGDVAVTKQGVRYQAILASWQQIEGAQASLGLLSLKSNGQWHKMPPSSKAIPGARLCAALIQRVKGLSN